MGYKSHLLVLEDEPDVLKEIAASLSQYFKVTAVSTLKEARKAFAKQDQGERYHVVVADMRLQQSTEGGLILAQELSERELRPEVVILTAFPDYQNASKCMQVDTFGYVEKGREDTFAILEDVCLQAEKHWHRRHQRIPDEVVDQPVALLFAEAVITPDREGPSEARRDETIESGLRARTRREITIHDGYITKFTPNSFLAIFNSTEKAVKTALAIRRMLTTEESPRRDAPFGLRQSIHIGIVSRVRMPDRDDITGPPVPICIRATEFTKTGQIVMSSQAYQALKSPGDAPFYKLKAFDQKTDGSKQVLYEVLERTMTDEDAAEHSLLPNWVRYALHTAHEIKQTGLSLPVDLAKGHDDYTYGMSSK